MKKMFTSIRNNFRKTAVTALKLGRNRTKKLSFVLLLVVGLTSPYGYVFAFSNINGWTISNQGLASYYQTDGGSYALSLTNQGKYINLGEDAKTRIGLIGAGGQTSHGLRVDKGSLFDALEGTDHSITVYGGDAVYGIYLDGEENGEKSRVHLNDTTINVNTQILVPEDPNYFGQIENLQVSNNSYGAYLTGNSELILKNSLVSTDGKSSHAIYALNNGEAELDNVKIITYGSNAHGLYAQDQGSLITAKNSTINATGKGVLAEEGGEIILDNTTVTTQKTQIAAHAKEGGIITLKKGTHLENNDTTWSGTSRLVHAEGAGSLIHTELAEGENFSFVVSVNENNEGNPNANHPRMVEASKGGQVILNNGTITGYSAQWKGAYYSLYGLAVTDNSDGLIEIHNVDIHITGKGVGARTWNEGDKSKTQKIAINGGTMTIEGDASTGLWASMDNSIITTNNLTLTMTGDDNAYGVYSESSRIDLTDTMVETQGAQSHGVVANHRYATYNGQQGPVTNDPSLITIKGGGVTAKGASSYALYIYDSAQINVENVTITTQGKNALGAYATWLGSINLSGDSHVVIKGSESVGILANSDGVVSLSHGVKVTNQGGGMTPDNLTSGSLEEGLITITDGDVYIEGASTLAAEEIVIMPNAHLYAYSYMDGNPSGGNSTLNQSSIHGRLINQGHLHLEEFTGRNSSLPRYSNQLTIYGDYHGENGHLYMNTEWNAPGNESGANSQSDHLSITGSAEGNTRVIPVTNGQAGFIAGDNKKTDQEQRTVDVITVEGGSNLGTFSGTASIGGAQEAQLASNDLGTHYYWYLPADPNYTPDPKPDPTPDPLIYAESTAGFVQMSRVNREMGFTQLGKLHDRVGELQTYLWDCCSTYSPYNAETGSYANPIWVRASLGELKEQGRDRFGYQHKEAFIQLGADLLFRMDQDKNHQHFGVMASYSHGTLDFYDKYRRENAVITENKRVGKGTTDMFSLGAYNTWYRANGTYLDLVGQVSYLRNQYKDSSDIHSTNQNGYGFGVSLEVGHPFKLGDSKNGSQWLIEPQAQLAYQYIHLNSVRAQNRYAMGSKQIHGQSDSTLRGRLGLRLARNWANNRHHTNTFYLAAHLHHDFIGYKTKAKITSFNKRDVLNERYSRTWGELQVGVQIATSQSSYLYSNVSYEKSFSGNKNKVYRGNKRAREEIKGYIGMRFHF